MEKLNGYYSSIKRRMYPVMQRTKTNISETAGYYKNNAQYGWERGRKLAKFQKRNYAMTIAIETISAAANTKIRAKDAIPLISCLIFSVTNPIPGFGVLGFALGAAVNKKLANCVNTLKKAIPKLKIK